MATAPTATALSYLTAQNQSLFPRRAAVTPNPIRHRSSGCSSNSTLHFSQPPTKAVSRRRISCKAKEVSVSEGSPSPSSGGGGG
ncbi:hypothetical protein LINPERHAP1_LOCUS15643 [Linum perenne]